MKCLVLFGSKSDKNVYEPLLVKLKKSKYEVDFEIISAHRDPKKLDEKLLKTKEGIIIAGAGLAAHLPGVIASKTKLPVFGIPCVGAYLGIDAYLSMANMPFGIPVFSSGVSREDSILEFMQNFEKINPNKVNIVSDDKIEKYEYYINEKNRLIRFLKELGIEFIESNQLDQSYFNISLVHNNEFIKSLDTLNKVNCFVPLFGPEVKNDPQKSLEVYNWSREFSGLWIGPNNSRNAVIFLEKLLNRNLFYRGSVKDIFIENSTTLRFKYSNRFSIFDWGEMPDKLNYKGDCLGLMAKYFFKYLENSDKAIHHLINKESSQNEMFVNRVNVIHPLFSKGVYDYSHYNNTISNTLIPLEVIFRFGIPNGSSILKRMKDKDYCKSIGITGDEKEGDMFDAPVVELSTKLESTDKMITESKALEITALSKTELSLLINKTKKYAISLQKLLASKNIILWDGKFEFAWDNNRNLMLVDSIGPDELRLTYNGTQLSKQVLRKYYENSDWKMKITEAKNIANNRKIDDWKSICKNELQSIPERLSEEFKEYMESMYITLTSEIIGKDNMPNNITSKYSITEVVNYINSFKA